MASVEEYKKRAASKPSKLVDDEVLSWVRTLWGTERLGKDIEIKYCDSYDDCNVCIRNVSNGSQFLLKVRNEVESKDDAIQEGIVFLMRSLEESGGAIVGVETPRLVSLSEGGKFYSKVRHNVVKGGVEDLAIWLQTWIPGHTMSSSKHVDPPLLEKVGAAVARVSLALADISHPGLKRPTYPWDLANVPMLEQYLSYVPEGPTRRDMVANILASFNRTVLPNSSTFRRSVVHGDINDSNIILTIEKGGGENVKGIIDWCDACESWVINEIAVAMAYAMVTSWAKETVDVLGAAAIVLRGYAAENGMQLNIRFPSGELKHLRILVAARLAQSVTLGIFNQVMGSSASNVCIHSVPAWRALEILWLDSPAAYCMALWKNALWGVQSVSLLRGGSSRVSLVQEMRLFLPGNNTDNSTSGDMKLAHDELMPMPPRTVYFITGNLNKLKEVNAILNSMCKNTDSPISLIHRKLDLPELQGDPVSIAEEKCRVASCRVMGPVIVEDTSLCFNSMGGLPGPYVKDFLEKLGPENLALMLSGYGDKSVNAQCLFTFCEGPGEKVQVFKGITKGRIVSPPRGKRTFGWDCIFEPLQEELKGMAGESDYHGLTYAELPTEVKNKISHRYKAVLKLGDALMKRCSG